MNTDLKDENDSSSVYFVTYNNINMLFMGDASVKTEKDLLDDYDLPRINILKVGHHGSNTSSSNEFIKKIKPTICLISVGEKNKFGHPKSEIIKRLTKYNCDIYRTDKQGSVEVKLNKNNYEILIRGIKC